VHRQVGAGRKVLGSGIAKASSSGAHMQRRAFITLIGGAAAWPLVAGAQVSTQRPLVAWLSGGGRSGSLVFVDAFLKGMHGFGYVEGVNYDIVYRYADGYIDRLPPLAEELVRLHPSVILAPASGPAVAAKHATSTIPIVTPALADAVRLGLIASESRPASNVTGIAPYVVGLPAKQMELAREVVPGAVKIAVLTNLDDPKAPAQWQELEVAGQKLGVNVVGSDVDTPDDLEAAFRVLARQGIDVMIVLQTSMLLTERRRIAALAATAQIPAVYGYREHVEDGGLVSYGVDLRECFRRGAYYVDKIIKGAAPSDLPVEFPTKLELVVNLKTARALGLTIPPTLLARADDVIE
jgi:putative ABC transport system substrate-binding protein